MEIDLSLPPKLIPVFTGQADVRGAYGGRGSGKTMSFAKTNNTTLPTSWSSFESSAEDFRKAAKPA